MTRATPRVKICGLREPAHARVAIDAGADFLGVTFAESPRRLTLEQARAIRTVAGPRVEVFSADAETLSAAIDGVGRPLLVGVFARQSADEINRIIAAVDLDLVQLSGGEHPSLAARLPRPVIRVHHIDTATTAEALLTALRREDAVPPPTLTHLDTHSDIGGGSGRTFDWSIAAAVARERPIMLAGGLTPENVAGAVLAVRPWALDVASGVESEERKDPDKIRAFVSAARAAPTPERASPKGGA